MAAGSLLSARRWRSAESWWLVAVLSWLAVVLPPPPTPLQAQTAFDECPPAATRSRIEVLDPSVQLTGNTCQGFTSFFLDYSDTCQFPGTQYGGNDVIYVVRLNKDNRVAFLLDVSEGADLVLALLEEPCEKTAACEASSLDFIGSGDESIPPRHYDPGTYFLSIDSASDGLAVCADESCCGPYTLMVTGTNPTPDLSVSLSASPDPEVVAGTKLTYTLTVTNSGPLAATGVEARLDLPAGTTFARASSGCRAVSGREALCTIGNLARDATSAPRRVTVRVSPSARGSLTTTATAQAVEGEPSPADNTVRITTAVRAETDLAIDRVTAEPEPVVAGCGLLYTATVTNRGPSEATEVVVADLLPAQVSFPAERPPARGCPAFPDPDTGSCPTPCELAAPGRLRCPMGRLAPDETATVCIPVTARSSALEPLANLLEVTGASDEEDTDPGNNQHRTMVSVRRQADLGVNKTARRTISQGNGQVLAGRTLAYWLSVMNRGPSDSSGAVVSDELPAGLTLLRNVQERTVDADCSVDESTVTCPFGPLAAGERTRVRLLVDVDPTIVQSWFANSATVSPLLGQEEDVDGANDDDAVNVRVEADLSLQGCDPLSPEPGLVLLPDPAVAGANLLHRITVSGCGPSDSDSGEVVVGVDLDDTAPELTFVTSPDGCYEVDEDGDPEIRCPFASVAAGGEKALRFVVRLDPSTLPGTELSSHAQIEGNHHEPPAPANDEAAASTSVTTEADLMVDQTDAPDPVLVGDELAYVVTVTNRGPSDAREVVVCDELPEGVTDESAEGCSPPGDDELCAVPSGFTGPVLQCEIGDVPAGGFKVLEIQARAPEVAGPITNLARVTDQASDPESATHLDPSNNESSEETTVAEPDDVDLVLTATQTTNTVRTGDTARYELVVEHRGPGEAGVSDVSVVVSVAPDTEVPASLAGDHSSCQALEGALLCALGDLASDDGAPRLELTATVDPGAPGVPGELLVVATIERPEGPPGDPYPDNDRVTLSTRVFDAPDLVLPWFETGRTAAEATTLFTIRNLSAPSWEDLTLRYVGGGGAQLAEPEISQLGPRALRSIALRDVVGDSGETDSLAGSVEIRRADGSRPEPGALAGDHFQVDPGAGSASGGLLVDTGSERSPRELCRRWSVRFLNGGPLGGSTELRFWVPEVPPMSTDGDVPDLAVRGFVFTEAGEPVQEVTIPLEDKAFVRRSTEPFDDGTLGRELLTASGAVEWEFPAGVVGNVSAVHRVPGSPAGGLAVEVPGTCLDPPFKSRQPGKEAPLVLPYLEVDPDGRTTLFSVRNEAEDEVCLDYRYFDSSGGDPWLTETSPLASKAVRTVNLQDVCARRGDECPANTLNPEPWTGFVEIQAHPMEGSETECTAGAPSEVFLSGDFVLVSPEEGLAAGGALVDVDPSRDPPQLCSHWSARLIHDGAGQSTDFLFYAPASGAAVATEESTFTGAVYDESGTPIMPEGPVTFDRAETTFRLPSGELLQQLQATGDLFGSVEWTFPAGRAGNVSTRFQVEGRFSILVPGVCLDAAEDSEP